MANLDDISKPTFCIPFTANEDDIDSESVGDVLAPSYDGKRDLDDGRQRRFEAYQAAWRKCLARIQDIIDALQRTTVDSVVNEVRTSYARVLPGLPYPELPVVSVINSSFGSSLLESVASKLATPGDVADHEVNLECPIIHLHPADMPNIQTAMKAIVSAFIETDDETEEQVKRKPSTSLASYDIRYLCTWYREWAFLKGSRPNLVVMLHDFEQFDPFVMQDVFYICSATCSDLPLVFVLAMSSPDSSYLNNTYPRATLALLRVRAFTACAGMFIFQDTMLKTFFDPSFDPDIMIGPSILEYLQDYFMRYNPSVDGMITILQLMHLRHFTVEPTTLLVQNTPDESKLEADKSSIFFESLKIRISLELEDAMDVDGAATAEREYESPASVIQFIDDARSRFYDDARSMRIAFQVLLRLQKELERREYKGLDWVTDPDKRREKRASGKARSVCDALVDLLQGRLGRDLKLLGMIIKKLRADELLSTVTIIHDLLYNLPRAVRAQRREAEATAQLVIIKTRIDNAGPGMDTEMVQTFAIQLSDWLMKYLSDRLLVLEDVHLWDIWYTGLAPFPAELLNPNIRASITAGLLRPYEFLEDGELALSKSKRVSIDVKMNGLGIDDKASASESKALWELPDSSILFKRYLDSGKTINVYDWFESFKSVLETQRVYEREQDLKKQQGEDAEEAQSHARSLRKRKASNRFGDRSQSDSRPSSPTPAPAKKGKGKEKEKEKDKFKVPPMTEKEEERWKIESQARFIRALHELDHLGLIKHTGRKADHVVRTVFEVDDAE